MVYLHPWEIDPGQPRVAAAWRSQFRHYQNLRTTEAKFTRLLDEFSWAPDVGGAVAVAGARSNSAIRGEPMAFKILSVVGARPNFMKVAALCEAIKEYNRKRPRTRSIEHVLVHTGQHYDANMSDSFFNDLELAQAKFVLGSRLGFSLDADCEGDGRLREGSVSEQKPHVVIVVGDVNSTVACALGDQKNLVCPGEDGREFIPKLAHVEAGLRSFDRTMPEEVNRIVTDALSDYLFTTEDSANQNLEREGSSSNKIHFVGNVMIDTLLRHRSKAKESTILNDLLLCTEGRIKPYAILTLHRPANVDDAPNIFQNPRVFSRYFAAYAAYFSRHTRVP